MSYKIFADGGCAPHNPGPGGFAFRIETPQGQVLEGWGHEAHATNNRMELLAAMHGLRGVPLGAAVDLCCDSRYVLDGCSQWRKGWQAHGMRKADGKPVLNAELWSALWAEVDMRRVAYTWVRGHAGHAGNERVDQLATAARKNRETVLPPAAALAKAARTSSQPAGQASEQAQLSALLEAEVEHAAQCALRPAYDDNAEAALGLLRRLGWGPRH